MNIGFLPHSSYEDQEEQEDDDEEVVVVSDDDDDDEVDSDSGENSGDESLDPESCITDSKVDPRDKVNAWVTRTGEHAFASMSPIPPSGLSSS